MGFFNRSKPAVPERIEPEANDSINQEQLLSALNGAQTALMMIDRDFNITYLNQRSMDLLKTHELLFKSIWPNFVADEEHLLGFCIDGFHSNPAHQRQMLSTPANLPYTTTITIQDVHIELNVGAIVDNAGNYIGNTLEWSDVTEERKQADKTARLQAAIDQAQTAMVMIDRDFSITYANKETVALFGRHESTLRTVWPGFTASEEWLMGRCIDEFHQRPEHQRKLLADPNNLPYSTDITIGNLIIELNVSAIHNASGEYVGNTLEWNEVTEARKRDQEVGRLASAVEGMTTNLMMADADGIITYLNPSLHKLLSSRTNELKQFFPNFDPDKLIGVSIDTFHKNPRHQQSIIANPENLPFSSNIAVGSLEFNLTCIAMYDSEGSFMGPALQWIDITEQQDGQRQIEALIQKAIDGELTERFDTSKYNGFMKELGSGVNSMLDTIVEPINQCIDVMSRVAEGDLNNSMSDDTQGEFGRLSNAVNTSILNLRGMVDKITQASASVATASSEIADGNDDLSQRVEAQASNLEQTAASMEEMTETVRQNADNAKSANKLAEDATSKASKGGEVVGRTVSAMAEINSASKKISDIIGVIDEIAFQTNLLALNAAVEAVRAGEQGRGFAVVAGEVRNLAQRSAAAAKEIKGLIKDSVEKVEEGTRLVDESGSTLEEIVSAVESVTDLVSQIAVSSSEQTVGIDEINRAIGNMDEMTQQNASLVEQTSAASQSLRDEGKELLKLMNFFASDNNVVTIDQEMAKPTRARKPAPVSKVQELRSTASASAHTKGGFKADEGDDWEEF
jgi:methyl-accepting chemotaxis protein